MSLNVMVLCYLKRFIHAPHMISFSDIDKLISTVVLIDTPIKNAIWQASASTEFSNCLNFKNLIEL